MKEGYEERRRDVGAGQGFQVGQGQVQVGVGFTWSKKLM